MSALHQRESTILEAALKLPPKDRVAYLDGACGGDAQLRQRIVEALFQAQERAAATAQTAPPPSPEKTIAITFTPAAPGEKPGDRIGRYKLLEQIGEGGMGTVWAAEQSEPVRRKVALKIIKLGMDTRQVIARFEAERQALALMDHPNIAKVLDAGATDTGRPYFVMEFVAGEPITTYCDRQNLPTRERLDLFVQVCRAIQHAHQKGIIHRDIKPSNILVAMHDGVPLPKVIDFGIAKATTGQQLTDKTLYTALEQFVGTPAYMSPEQAEMAGVDIDTRSDIYSLGVMLYELLTSKVPFEPKRLVQAGLDEIRRIIREEEPARPSTRISALDAAEQTTVARRRQSEPPKLIHQVRGDLDWIVMKCLEKDRTRRYETANALALDIQRHLGSEPVLARPPSKLYLFRKMVRRNKPVARGVAVGLILAAVFGAAAWRAFLGPNRTHSPAGSAGQGALDAVPGSDGRASIAVLPFVNMSSEKDSEYFSDGLTEQLITLLAQIKGLKVTGRTSCFVFKGKNASLREIGKQLGVGTVLEGGVQRAGSQVRITAQLVRVNTDEHLWATNYDRDLTNIFAIQSDVAEQVVKALRVRLLPEERLPLEKVPTENLEAHNLYLLGRYHLARFTPEGFVKGLDYFHQAIQKDPKYALAYVGVADAYGWMGSIVLPERDALAKSKEAVEQALALDDGLAAAHIAMGGVRAYGDYDWAGGEREFKRAIELNPSDALAHNAYAELLTVESRVDDATVQRRIAVDLDPLSPLMRVNLGFTLFFQHAYGQAFDLAQKALELDPNFGFGHSLLGWCYNLQGKNAEAVIEFQKARALGDLPIYASTLAYGFAQSGDRVAAQRILEELDKLSSSKQRYVSPLCPALVYLGLGENERALDWLEKCYEEHDIYFLIFYLHPAFDEVRSDPRFKALLHRFGLDGL